MKGIGGFHLACAATNPTAIAKLRERKGRIEKPLAVMVRDVDQATRFAVVTQVVEKRLLESSARPIVLLTKRQDMTKQRDINDGVNLVSEAVAPGNSFVGVMLPYSPLHYLLIDQSPLVMTSRELGR